MTRLPRSASLLAMSVLLFGCEPMVIEIGSDHIAPVVVERLLYTGLEPEDGCPAFQIPYVTLDRREGEATIAPHSSGCLLAFREMDVVLMPAETMAHWSAQLAGYDMGALMGADLVVNELVIFDGVSTPIPLDELEEVSFHFDGRVLFTREDMQKLESEELRVTVPQELVDRFLMALDAQSALTAELEMRIVLREGRAVPGLLLVRTELQPVLRINAWDAIF